MLSSIPPPTRPIRELVHISSFPPQLGRADCFEIQALGSATWGVFMRPDSLSKLSHSFGPHAEAILPYYFQQSLMENFLAAENKPNSSHPLLKIGEDVCKLVYQDGSLALMRIAQGDKEIQSVGKLKGAYFTSWTFKGKRVCSLFEENTKTQ